MSRPKGVPFLNLAARKQWSRKDVPRLAVHSDPSGQPPADYCKVVILGPATEEDLARRMIAHEIFLYSRDGKKEAYIAATRAAGKLLEASPECEAIVTYSKNERNSV